MELIGYIAALLMGAVLGMLGGGGAILTVPILVYLFKFDPVTATGTSMFVVGLTSLVGSITYIKRNEISYSTFLLFALPGFVAVYITRNFLLPSIPETVASFAEFTLTKNSVIMIVFAAVLLWVSYSMIIGKRKSPNETEQIASHFLIVLRGFFVGALTGFIGAGGGFVIVPALIKLVGLRMRTAVGTSLLIIATNSLLGFFTNRSASATNDWKFLAIFSSLALVGIMFGSQLANRIPETHLKIAFGWLVLVMGSGILLMQLS